MMDTSEGPCFLLIRMHLNTDYKSQAGNGGTHSVWSRERSCAILGEIELDHVEQMSIFLWQMFFCLLCI